MMIIGRCFKNFLKIIIPPVSNKSTSPISYYKATTPKKNLLCEKFNYYESICHCLDTHCPICLIWLFQCEIPQIAQYYWVDDSGDFIYDGLILNQFG